MTSQPAPALPSSPQPPPAPPQLSPSSPQLSPARARGRRGGRHNSRRHSTSLARPFRQAAEEVATEARNFQKCLVRMFAARGAQLVSLEQLGDCAWLGV